MEPNSFHLNVPDPCHEDWNKMSPRDNGSFCTSCEKTVVDFSRMSDREVAQYMKMNADRKVCGRFSNTQLNRPISVSVNPDITALKAFVYVLFLVFGSALFSYKVISENQTSNVSSSITASINTDSFDENSNCHVVGALPYPFPINAISSDTFVTDIGQNYITGEPMMPENIKQANQTDSLESINEMPDTSIRQKISLEEVKIKGNNMNSWGYTVGVMLPTINYRTFEADTINELKNDSLNSGDQLLINEPKLECFPNPSNGIVNIRYMIPKRSNVHIELYDISGRKLMDLVTSNQLYEGTYIYTADVTAFADGTYICYMMVGDKMLINKLIIAK